MDKMIWKVLAEEQGCKLSGEDCNGKSCLRYYTCKGIASAILTLFKQEMLRLIGDDKDDVVYGQDMSFDRGLNNGKVYGYNQAKQELRNAINTEGER
jgi:hypothetical protein